MWIVFLITICLCNAIGTFADFGFTDTGSAYHVDNGGNLTFDVSKSTGDITSMKYNGVEYQDSAKLSAINSGLGTSTVTAQKVGTDYVKLTLKSSGLPVTHYFVVKPKDDTIYMATYITGEVDPGELRWLARMKRSALPNGMYGGVADVQGCTAFEGKDTFRCPNGQTRCKFYTSDRFIDDIVHGVTGPSVGVWMIMPGTAYETSAGGPFFRDINNQADAQQELYWYMNSNHVRTEPWRFGLMGPYAMKFTPNTTPPSGNLDLSFFGNLSIQGFVGAAGRGTVSGSATGVPSNFETVLHWYNDQAQYWTKAVNGKYTSPAMKSGAYTMKLYKQEFLVATSTVTVVAGQTVTKDIVSTEATPTTIWRIGDFDGQPFDLKNGDKILRMHPSDPRMAAWGGTYTVGTSTSKDFPMAVWGKEASSTPTIKFTLSAQQTGTAKLRIGTTLSFKGGRPSVKLNSWSGSDPGAPKLIDSRGVTRGAYRGYGEVYSWDVPTGTLKAGDNTLVIGVAGSGDSDWLSANFIFDAVELQGTPGSTSTR